MVAHVVLLRVKASLSEAEREALLEAMRLAFTGISEIRRVRIGRRIRIGRGYEAQMAEHFEYSAIIEFDSEADLRAYLDHPQHQELGRRFFESADAALVYDYRFVDAEHVRQLI
ncbi:MAG: Dabb family protein [Vicinamibacterales bacterium]